MVCRLILFSLFINNLFGANTVKYGGELYIDGRDARNAGMGGYSASFSDGSNPALLLHVHESSIHFSHKNKFAGLAKISSFSYLHHELINGKQSPLYFSLVNRSVDNIPDTRAAWTDDGDSKPEMGEIDYFSINEFSQNELGLKIAYLRKYDKIAFGISIKPTHIDLAEYSAWGLSGDIAAIVPLFNNKMEFSFRVEDIISFNSWNTGTIETNMPLVMAGGRIQAGPLLIGMEAGSRLEDYSQLNYHAGFELHKQHEIIIIRGGISHDRLFSVGFGLDLEMLQIDYAYMHPPTQIPFDSSHIVSVGIFLKQFDRTKGKITS